MNQICLALPVESAVRVVALAWIATAFLLAAAVPAQAAFPGTNGLIAFERKNGAEDSEIYNTANARLAPRKTRHGNRKG